MAQPLLVSILFGGFPLGRRFLKTGFCKELEVWDKDGLHRLTSFSSHTNKEL
jgi:hypothetical protein